MAEEPRVDRTMALIVLAEGSVPDSALRILGATPPELSRSVMDLDRNELVAVVNPPTAFLREENGVWHHISLDEVRSWLDPASIGPLVKAMARARQMEEGETMRYSLDYHPPTAAPFRMLFEVHPLLLDSRGMAYMIYSDVRLEPL